MVRVGTQNSLGRGLVVLTKGLIAMVKHPSQSIATGLAIPFATLLATLSFLAMGVLFPLPAWAAQSLPSWSYGGAANPTQWGDLSQNFASCQLGQAQSPINLGEATEGAADPITFAYQPTPLSVTNTGHTIQVNYAPGSQITLDGQPYELLQFHFHTPSEHTIQGKASALELHFVHRNSAGKLAVVGVMINAGAENTLIDQVWNAIPAAGDTKTVPTILINGADLLPKNHEYFSYEGSLTTPPCSEGVKWNVLVEPITISAAAIDAFQALYPVNARPLQAVHDRKVVIHRG